MHTPVTYKTFIPPTQILEHLLFIHNP